MKYRCHVGVNRPPPWPWPSPERPIAGELSWWRHQMETSSALLPLCGEFTGHRWIPLTTATGEFPSQRPVTRSFDVFFDLRLNKQLSKPSRPPVIWDAIALIMMTIQCSVKSGELWQPFRYSTCTFTATFIDLTNLPLDKMTAISQTKWLHLAYDQYFTRHCCGVMIHMFWLQRS